MQNYIIWAKTRFFVGCLLTRIYRTFLFFHTKLCCLQIERHWHRYRNSTQFCYTLLGSHVTGALPGLPYGRSSQTDFVNFVCITQSSGSNRGCQTSFQGVREMSVLMTGNLSIYYSLAAFCLLLQWIMDKNARFVQTQVS